MIVGAFMRAKKPIVGSFDSIQKLRTWSALKSIGRRSKSISDQNASFEGIAVGNQNLWLANERERARVIEVDLETLKVVGDFAPEPSFWALVTHYSDICWFKGLQMDYWLLFGSFLNLLSHRTMTRKMK